MCKSDKGGDSSNNRMTSSSNQTWQDNALGLFDNNNPFSIEGFDEEDTKDNNALSNLLYQFGVVLFNFENAQVRVSGFLEKDRVFDAATLTDRLMTHYKGKHKF